MKERDFVEQFDLDSDPSEHGTPRLWGEYLVDSAEDVFS